MSKTSKHFYEFGDFCLDASEKQLRRGGEQIPLTPKAFGVLLLFVRNSGHLLEKEDFMREVWPDTIVEEKNVADNVSTLRRLLGDSAGTPAYIETVPRRGYRFVAKVTEVLDEGADLIVEEESRARIVIEETDEPGTEVIEPNDAREEKLHALDTRRVGRVLKPVVVLVCALLAGLLIFGAYFFLKRADAPVPASASPIKSIAILPFKPLSAEGRDEYLELGMTDALITKLSSVRQVLVRPTSTVRKYTDLQQDPLAAGREMTVDSVLEGNIQRVGDRLRVTVRLLRVADGTPLWAEKFDEKFTDIFAVQDSISERVASVLALKLSGEEMKGLAKRYTDNVEAYQLYLKGLHNWSTFNQSKLLASINYYNEALKIDPNYAIAYTGIANAYSVIGLYGPLTAKEAMPKAVEAAQKALELDGSLAEAHVALGAVKIFHEWDWPGAERELKRAMELNPNLPDPHNLYGYYLQAMGRGDDAVIEIKRAKELAPEWFIPNRDYLLALFKARRYDEAIEQSQQVAKLEPDDYFAHYVLGVSYTQQGRYTEAEAELRRAINVPGRQPSSRALTGLGYFYGVTGKKGEALKVIEQLKEKPTPWMPFQVAEIYAGLGDKDQAFAWLDRAYEERCPFLWHIKPLPHFDSLRSDPRFTELLRKMRLE